MTTPSISPIDRVHRVTFTPPVDGVDTHAGLVRLPRLRSMVRHALPHVVEGSLLPVAVFYLALYLSDVWGAIIAALIWSYLGVARRALARQRASGLLIITALTLTVRFLISFFSGSVTVYFLQPAAANLVVAAAFAGSVWSGRPLLERLAGDFVPMDESLTARPCIRRFFRHISLLWAVVLVVHTALGVWLLFSVSVETYVLVKSILNAVVKGGVILLSAWMFRRVLRRRGYAVAYG
jgi:uncharacterized membrane protein